MVNIVLGVLLEPLLKSLRGHLYLCLLQPNRLSYMPGLELDTLAKGKTTGIYTKSWDPFQ